MLTFLQLKTGIRNDIWPSGEPENLVVGHDNAFQEAAAEIAKWVKCEQTKNANVVQFCQTNYKGGMTVLAAPVGRIYRIFTVANQNFDDPVFYRQTEWPEPESWARNLYLFPGPLVTDSRPLPLGFGYANAVNDSAYGRARTGIWAIHNGNIYIAPWIQSNELVVIEWDGIKENWADADLVNPAIKYRQAIKLYVQYAHERDYGTEARADKFKNRQHSGWFDEVLEDLMDECKKQTELRETPGYDNGGLERDRLCSELSDDAAIPDADGVTIADLGNINLPGPTLDSVAALAKSWGPDAVTACGMIASGQPDYDATAGAEFCTFIAPYVGNKGAGAAANAFFPVPGTTDWQKDMLASMRGYFAMPGRYYAVVIGDVHLFVLDASAGAFEPDGIASNSVQGVWLQSQLALSTAPWKVVKMEGDPWGSINSNPILQWPFSTWGAHLVICSQTPNYERLLAGGLPIVNNGLGGGLAPQEITAINAASQAAYAANYGAGRLMATALNLIYEFWSIDGTLVDTLSLSK